jgi:hypothetical protein
MPHHQTKEEAAPVFHIPFTIVNLEKHFERSCDLWTHKDPTLQQRLIRSAIFVCALLCTIFWPIHDIIVNVTLLLLVWIILSLTSKPVPRFLLMLNLMMNLAVLYSIIRLITGT